MLGTTTSSITRKKSRFHRQYEAKAREFAQKHGHDALAQRPLAFASMTGGTATLRNVNNGTYRALPTLSDDDMYALIASDLRHDRTIRNRSLSISERPSTIRPLYFDLDFELKQTVPIESVVMFVQQIIVPLVKTHFPDVVQTEPIIGVFTSATMTEAGKATTVSKAVDYYCCDSCDKGELARRSNSAFICYACEATFPAVYTCSGCSAYLFATEECDACPSTSARTKTLRPSVYSRRVQYEKSGFHVRFSRHAGPFVDAATHTALTSIVQQRAPKSRAFKKCGAVDWQKVIDAGVVSSGLRVLGTTKYSRCPHGKKYTAKGRHIEDHSSCCYNQRLIQDTRPGYTMVASLDLFGQTYGGTIDTLSSHSKLLSTFGIRAASHASRMSSTLKKFLLNKAPVVSASTASTNVVVSMGSGTRSTDASLDETSRRTLLQAIRKLSPFYRDINISKVTLMRRNKTVALALQVVGSNRTYCPILKRNHSNSNIWFLVKHDCITARCFCTKHKCNTKKSDVYHKANFVPIFRRLGLQLTATGLVSAKRNRLAVLRRTAAMTSTSSSTSSSSSASSSSSSSSASSSPLSSEKKRRRRLAARELRANMQLMQLLTRVSNK